MGHLENVALKLFSFLRTNFRKYKRREAVGQLYSLLALAANFRGITYATKKA
jgi:hypothetical protein